MILEISMDLLFKIPIMIALLLFTISCSPLGAHSIENTAVEVSATPEPKKPDGSDRIIKPSGWRVPSRNDTRIGDQSVETAAAADGTRTEVKGAYFTPTNEIVYEEMPVEGALSKVQDELKLIHFRELSLKGRVYLYEITARKYASIGQLNNNASHEEIFTYRILDNDGDGKFETLVTKPDSKVMIPKWLLDK